MTTTLSSYPSLPSNNNNNLKHSNNTNQHTDFDLSELTLLVNNLAKSKYLPILQTIIQQCSVQYNNNNNNNNNNTNNNIRKRGIDDLIENPVNNNNNSINTTLSREYQDLQYYLNREESLIVHELSSLLSLCSLIRPVNEQEKVTRAKIINQQFSALRQEINNHYYTNTNSTNNNNNNLSLLNTNPNNNNNNPLGMSSNLLNPYMLDGLDSDRSDATPPSKRRNTNINTNTNPNTSMGTVNNSSQGNKKRGTLPKHCVTILKQWLWNHFAHPYPTETEKTELANLTGCTTAQVNYWFINARVRIWRPLLEMDDNTRKQQLIGDNNINLTQNDFNEAALNNMKMSKKPK